MRYVMRNVVKSTHTNQCTGTNDRRPPVVRKTQGIDDPACLLTPGGDLAESTTFDLTKKCVVSRHRRRFDLTIAPQITRRGAMLTDSVLRALRCFGNHTLECFSSSRLYGGSVKALGIGAVNRGTTRHFWEAITTLSGRDLTPKGDALYVSACY